MKEFKDKIREKMDEEGVSPEKLATIIKKEGENKTDSSYTLSANAIRGYLKGTRPKSTLQYDILAEHYKVPSRFFSDDDFDYESHLNFDIASELFLSDKAIENIKSVKNIKNFNEDTAYKQNTKNNFDDNTFSVFIASFRILNEYLEKFKEFIHQIELQKHIHYLKTICDIPFLIDNYIENEKNKEINELIHIYNKIFENIKMLSSSNIYRFYINGSIKEYYNKIIKDITNNNKSDLSKNIDNLKSELYQIILFIEKDRRRCEYELNLIMSKFYEDLLNQISKNFLLNSTNYVNEYIINIIKDNKKLMEQNKK